MGGARTTFLAAISVVARLTRRPWFQPGLFILAGAAGFEPALSAPKADVLPLNDAPHRKA